MFHGIIPFEWFTHLFNNVFFVITDGVGDCLANNGYNHQLWRTKYKTVNNTNCKRNRPNVVNVIEL